MGREADELGLARLADRVGRFLELLAGDHVDRFVDGALVAQPVDEEEVDVVGPQRGKPLVDHAEHFAGRARHVFGDEDDFLANLRVLLKPLLEVLLGAVDLGRVEDPDAVGIGDPEDAFVAPDRSGLEHRDFDAGLAQLALGKHGGLRDQLLPWQPASNSRPRPSPAHRPGETCGDRSGPFRRVAIAFDSSLFG